MKDPSLTHPALAKAACSVVPGYLLGMTMLVASSVIITRRSDPRDFHPSHTMNPDACVSAIIPARNEERTIARAVRSVAEQPEVREIVVIDDQSSDGTGEILRRLACEEPKLRAVRAPGSAGGLGGEEPRGMAWRGESGMRLACFSRTRMRCICRDRRHERSPTLNLSAQI